MWQYFSSINVLYIQIEAMLDLLQCSKDSVDIQSVRTVAEMCQTMLDELMAELNRVKNELDRVKEDNRVDVIEGCLGSLAECETATECRDKLQEILSICKTEEKDEHRN